MHTATKRTIIAAAGLAAAGLVGSLPYHGSMQAQGVPIQHHDVALVDSSDILTPETTLDTTFFNDLLGAGGAEDQLYTAVQTSLGTTDANLLLDTGGAEPVFSGIFNGAVSRASEALFIEGLVSEDQANQLLGVTESASQAALLADLIDNPGPSIPASADVTLAELTGAVGTSAFDTDLTQIANADYAFAMGDFQGYLTDLSTNLGSLGDGSSLDGLGVLGSDLTTLLAGLGSGLL